MSALLFAGCLFLAYGPPTILLLGFILKKSYLFIVTLTSAFIWLLALLLVAIIWYIIPPLRTLHAFNIAVTVVIEEIVRFVYLRMYMKSEIRMAKSLPKAFYMLNDFTFTLSAGLGFSFMQNIIMYGAIIGAARHESAVYLDTCPTLPLPALSAILALLLFVSHEELMVMALDGMRRQSKLRMAAVPILHMLIAELTLLSKTDSGCQGMLPLISAVVIVMGLWTAHVVMSHSYAGKVQVAAMATNNTPSHPPSLRSSAGSSPTRPLVQRARETELVDRRRK